jgi:hypothetical protein
MKKIIPVIKLTTIDTIKLIRTAVASIMFALCFSNIKLFYVGKFLAPFAAPIAVRTDKKIYSRKKPNYNGWFVNSVTCSHAKREDETMARWGSVRWVRWMFTRL